MDSSNSLLGSNWFQTFSEFRLNPDLFFDKRKLTREAFCLDILRDIYLEHIDIQSKIHLLLLLQEYSFLLIKDINLLEQISGSLSSVFKTSKINSCENRFLRSQILICITTILLSSDVEEDVDELISNQRELLLKVIYNKTEDFIVMSCACKCLEEIEVFFPNTLESELKNIFQSCEKHLSPAFQNYASLLSLCLKNSCLHNPDDMKMMKNGGLKIDNYNDSIQLPAVISYLMELIPLMTPMSVYNVLKNLIPVIKLSHDVSPVVFKFFVPYLIFSSEVVYFNIAFDLLEEFGSDLFSAQEEFYLLRQLIYLSSHPCLTSSHRMLFLEWLKSCILKDKLSCNQFPMLKFLLPGPFDGPLTQEKKCCILAMFVSKDVNKDLGMDFLNESITGLKKCALLPQKTKAAASFFRTLFAYFSYYSLDLMHKHIYKLLLSIMKSYPHLLPFALNFLDAVKTKYPESTFPKEVLTHLVDHILSLPMKQFTNNLEYYLAILEQASEVCGPECKPRSILRLLQKLFSKSTSNGLNVWEFGNNILSVCRSILLFHNVQLFYYDLAEILCIIAQNIDDAEVEYRAKIYYNELITLSKLKIQSIFKVHRPEKDACSLASFVPGVTTNLQFAPRVQLLPKPVLELVRIKKACHLPREDNSVIDTPSDIEILRIYKEYLDISDSVVELPFLLKHVSKLEKNFDTLFGVVILTKSSPACKETSVIQLPVYRYAGSAKGNVFCIDIVPNESHPTELHFEVEFTCSNGQSYICYPDPVFLDFEDFFLPLPTPQNLKECHSSWKKILFENLWEELEKQQTLISPDQKKSCKSTICLKVSKEKIFTIIEDYWKLFVVARFDSYKHWIAIFLPQRNHLLMKIDVINNKPFLNFIVDDISKLPWIALYLQKIERYNECI